MRILFVSDVTSNNLFETAIQQGKVNSGFAIQKFCNLLVRGFNDNEAKVTSLSVAPFSVPYKKTIYSKFKDEIERNVFYKYIPFLGIPIFKQAFTFFYSFFYTIKWCMEEKKGSDTVVFCDVLKISVSFGCVLAARIMQVKSTGLVTDMPGTMSKKDKNLSFKQKSIAFFNKSYIGLFNSYIFMTELANKVLNHSNKPYMLFDGLVDSEDKDWKIEEKYEDKVITYAGGVGQRNGVKMLVEAFKLLKIPDAKLFIFGDGPYAKELLEEAKQDNRICYKGIASNYEVMMAEKKSTLLVDPYPTSDEFTFYSYPSKNIEYMMSGTPLVTTRFVGIQKEDYPYIYFFDEETVEGYARTLTNILKEDRNVLKEKGALARRYVYENKNNILQGRRIIKFLRSL